MDGSLRRRLEAIKRHPPESRVDLTPFWDSDLIKQMVLTGTAGDDTLIGYSTSDSIHGYESVAIVAKEERL